jgi:hypothetical protein
MKPTAYWLLTMALTCAGVSFYQTAIAGNVCIQAGVSPLLVKTQTEDSVTIHWNYDGPSICRESYNVSLGLVGQGQNQQFEVAGSDCPTVPPFGEPQRVCRHTLLIPCCMKHSIGVQACHKHTGLGASSECSPWRSVEVGSVYAVNLTQPNGAIYAIVDNGDLLWYGHDGRNDGTFRWAVNSVHPELNGRKVGNGWNVKQVFSGGDGIIYAITQNNDLMWYRHDGRNDGTFRWAFNEGKKVGNGWSVKQVFSGATLAP